MISAPSSSRASWVSALTQACVPTGMKKGVSTGPWGVVRRPRRAPAGSVFPTSKEKFIFGKTPDQKRAHAPCFCVSGEDERDSDSHNFIDGPHRKHNTDRAT